MSVGFVEGVLAVMVFMLLFNVSSLSLMFMWWGSWDYFTPNFHLMVWFKMRGIVV